MRRYYYNPDSSFRYIFDIDYLSDDEDKVESLELAGDSITFLFNEPNLGECYLVVDCDCTQYSFDFDRIVYFRYIDRFNTQLADYL